MNILITGVSGLIESDAARPGFRYNMVNLGTIRLEINEAFLGIDLVKDGILRIQDISGCK